MGPAAGANSGLPLTRRGRHTVLMANPIAVRLLTSPIALAALALLAVNDHYLKAAYHNGLTGKLSDVAGVVLLPFFLKAISGCRNWVAVVVTGLFFTWWKSPYSQGFLDAFNSLGWFHAGRVVDYTDLLALVLLPLAYYALRDAERRPAATPQRLVLSRYAVFPLCLFFLQP